MSTETRQGPQEVQTTQAETSTLESAQLDLQKKIDQYKANHYKVVSTFGEEGEELQAQENALLERIETACAQALLEHEEGAAMQMIKKTILNARHEDGAIVLPIGAQVEFLEKVAVLVAKMAKAKETKE